METDFDEIANSILEQIGPLTKAGFVALADGLFAFRERLIELGYPATLIDGLELAALGHFQNKAGSK